MWRAYPANVKSAALDQAVLFQELRPHVCRAKGPGFRDHLDARPISTLNHGFGNAGLQPSKRPQRPRLDCDHLCLDGFTTGNHKASRRIDQSAQLRNLAREMLRHIVPRMRIRRFQFDEGNALLQGLLDPIDITLDIGARYNDGLARIELQRRRAMIGPEHTKYRALEFIGDPDVGSARKGARKSAAAAPQSPPGIVLAGLHDPIQIIVGFAIKDIDPGPKTVRWPGSPGIKLSVVKLFDETLADHAPSSARIARILLTVE